MLAASLAEIFSIGAVLPFLGVLTAPESVFAHPAMQPLIQIMGIEDASDLLLPTTAIFCFTAVSAGAIRILLLRATTRYAHAVGADISLDMYVRTLYQPYRVHVSRNSSEIINGIVRKSSIMVDSVLSPALALFSTAILLSGISVALVLVDPSLAISAGLVFAVIYSVILRLTKGAIRRNGETIAQCSTEVVKALQEGLGGIRDVLLDNTQKTYSDIYWKSDRPLRLALANSQFIAGCPRFILEAFGMVFIAAFAFVISQRENGIIEAIPVLGAVALGAQRLLPVMQLGYQSLTLVRSSEASLRDSLVLLRQPLPRDLDKTGEPLPFALEIEFNDIGFGYNPARPILENIDLLIKKGMRVGFFGATGSGKSTLMDLLMGLVEPDKGIIAIDGQSITQLNQRSWQRHIAHVPQAIFLSDSSIAENIAFGIPPEQIDNDRVTRAADQAQIGVTINSWPEKYATKVGERGVRLSGGQRQRIGIARALYKQASALIFDEATSALDTGTERAVMEAIDGLDSNLTIIIVAHRLSTLEKCDLIVELADGRIKRLGTYRELISNQ